MTLLPSLLNVQSDNFQESWNKLFFEVNLVRRLKEEVDNPDTAQKLLLAGAE